MAVLKSSIPVCVFACALSAVAPVRAAEVAWVPLEADGPHTVNGNEIVLQGGGQLVTLEIRISDWDPDLDGDPEIGTYQAAVEESGYSSGAGDPLTAFADPTPTAGAFITRKMCHIFDGVDLVPTGIRCDAPFTCPAGQICLDNPFFIFAGILSQASVSTSTPNYVWGAVTQPGQCADDDGVTAYYAGTLILEVPSTARGTYTIGFDPNPLTSFLNDCLGTRIPDVTFTPAQITIACQTNADCDDGDACTDDTCGLGNVCSNAPNYNPLIFCCDPVTGALTAIDDGNDCTEDICESDGTVTRNPAPPGVPCGGPPSGECDAQDRCDGFGICQELFQPPQTACGDGGDTDCTNPDTCSGFGSCLSNDEPPGTPCGDPTPTQCSDPDTCNGSGACLPNHLPPGTPCDDGAFCNEGEACLAGACTGGQFACDDGISCTEDSCDEVFDLCDNVPNDSLCNNGQFCDGVEICDVALDCVIEPGSVPNCDDGVTCTNDSCDELNDICRFIPDDANCDNGLFCDGEERCDPIDDCVLEVVTVPDCDDGIDCTVDSCNESFDRCDNLPDDALCPDDGLFCNGEEICDSGAGCVSTGCPCGTACELSCDEDLDVCLCEAPLAEAVGSRYMMVTPLPPDSTAPQAIVITPACATGQPRYVGQPQPWDVNGDHVIDGSLAFLMDDPAEAAFLTPAQWGAPVYVTGEALVPETSHRVQVDCGAPGAPSLSAEATPRPATWVWTDTDQNDSSNFADIQFMVFAFQGIYIPGKQILPNLDVRSTTFCLLDQISNFNDIQAAVLAFQGQDYIDTGCPYDCPPCLPDVHCNDNNECTTDTCNADGSCQNTPIFDTQVSCCDPATGVSVPIDDGDPCTNDGCNMTNGQVSHVPVDCDDGVECTVDECNGGICSNIAIDSITCSDNSDCPAASPGCAGHCTCPGTPAVLYEWQPVSSTGSFEINGTEIVIPQGGVQVTVHLMISNWAPDDLGAYQATILGDTSYVSGDAGSLAPLTDPNPSAGAFVAKFLCTPNGVDFFEPCNATPDCPAPMWCTDNPDYVFAGRQSIAAAATSQGVNYAWGAVITGGPPVLDDGTRKYGATLILEVSPDAAGTFTLEFDPSLNNTFVVDGDMILLRPLTLAPGFITVATGKCCWGLGLGPPVCEDGMSEAGCLVIPENPVFSPGVSCLGDPLLDCRLCNVDGDCNDGNACTDEWCDTNSICSRAKNYDDAVVCCNPANRALTAIDDMDPCTVDTCDEATGHVSHAPIPGCTPPSACAIEDDVNCKFGPDMWLALSDRSVGVRFVDDFRPATPILSQVCWWPCFLNPTTGAECFQNPPPDDFVVRFYEDLGGLPGPEVGPPGGQPLLPSNKVWMGGNSRCWSYTAPLTSPVNVVPGGCYWIEITGDSGQPGGCNVFIGDSAEGNDFSLIDDDNSYGADDVAEVDMAVCLDAGLTTSDDCGPKPGACCLCDTGCLDASNGMDHVQCAAQEGHFTTAAGCTEVFCGVPGNDACAAAELLTHAGGDPANDILVDFNVGCATLDGPSPVSGCENGDQPMGHDIWFDYVAPCTGDLTVSLCDNTGFDTMLVLYGSGASCTCPVDGSTQLSCNDDGCGGFGGAGTVTIPVVTGNCFTVRVGGWGNAGTPGGGESFGAGTMRVSIACDGAPGNPPPCETQKLRGSDTVDLDAFGYSVDVDGAYAVVGARDDESAAPLSGSAYMFEHIANNWVQRAKLLAADAAQEDRFGAAVSINGDVVIVGAPQVFSSGPGKAYVFRRSGLNWTQEAMLTVGDAAADAAFGFSVAVSRDTAVVGAFQDKAAGNDSGSAYVFRWNGSTWVEEAKLIASDGAANDMLGHAVAIEGDYAVLGAPGAVSSHSGAAYVFFRTGSNWTQQARLSASDGATGDSFGSAVAISGNRVAVGAENDDTLAGAVYVFQRIGSVWTQSNKLIANDRADSDHFGFDVGIDGDSLVAGAVGDDDYGNMAGSAYLFRHAGSSWSEVARVGAADAADIDSFGWAVAVYGDTALISAVFDDIGAGAVYAFALSGPDANGNNIIDACE